MARGRDEAGNIWELDASGNPMRLVQAAPQARAPGALGTFIPPSPVKGQQEQANLTRTQQEIAKDEATAASTAEKARAEAQSARIKAQTDQEAYDSAHPKGTGATVIGPGSLKNLSVPDQELVKALAEGRLAFPGGFALKAPWWQQKLEQVAQFDPTFDATNFNNRAKARATLLNGKVGASANALNTAIGHLDLLNGQISGTASHNFTPANSLINATEQMFGDPGITNFKDTAGKLASELTSVYRNGGGAEADVVRQLQSLDPNASKDQKTSVIRNALDLLASKQAANLYQYNLGSGGKPAVDLLDPSARAVLDRFPDIRDKYFAPPPQGLSTDAVALLKANGGTPPPPPPAPPAAPGAPLISGGGPKLPGGVPTANYSSMVGGPGQSVATQGYRNVYDPVGASALSAFIRNGAPYETAAAYATSHGFNPPPAKDYAAAVAYQRANPNATPNVEADRLVPTTVGERLSASPLAAGIVAAGSGATAGLSDVAGRMLAGDQYDANRQALSALNPKSDIAGNVVGGVGGAFAAPALAARIPGAMGLASQIGAKLGKFAPMAGDAAYGGLYGADENPNDPLAGAGLGALIGGGAGVVGRKLTSGLANVIAPPEGTYGPLYQAGIFPTPGQRFARSGLAGRILNGTEQALQSVPVLGAAPATARQATRDAFQVGAFNNSLKELQPFADAGIPVPTSLPNGVGPGTQAHSLTSDAFNKAYDVAKSGMQFVPNDQYTLATTQFAKDINNGILSPSQTGQVSDVIRNAVTGRLKTTGGVLNGDAYKAASSDLDSAISAWGKNPNTSDMANALSDYKTIFDNAARSSSDPNAVNLLDAADRGYAQFVRIQRASQMGGAAKDAGTFTPVNYAGAAKDMGGGLRSNAYSQGNALGQDYAASGLNLRDTLADSGTATRLGVIGAAQGLEGGGLAAAGKLGMLVNPKVIGAFAPYLPGVRELTNRVIAPRQFTLPPILSQPLNIAGSKLNDVAPFIGKAAIPGSLAYMGYDQ